jgi:signal transduction histidine kinase
LTRIHELSAGRGLRLALGFALTIGAITLGAFALVYLEVAREEVNRVGVILTQEARLNADAPEDRLRAALAARQLSEIRRIDYLAVLDPRGRLLFGNLTAAPPAPPDGRPHFFDARAMIGFANPPAPTIFVASPRPDGGVLLLGRTLIDAYEVEATLWRALALALAPTVVLFVVIAALFARQAARRFAEVNHAISRIMHGDFTSRLPVSRDGDEIDHIASAVNVMLDEIARLVEQLKNAGDNIAHELRAPLAVARAKLESALQHDCGSERPRMQAAMEQLDRASQTIAALLRIADVKNGRHRQRFQEVDLADLCVQTVEFYEPLAEAKGIHIAAELDGPVVFRGDEDLLREALFNLVGNAVKFTPTDGDVKIAVARDDGGVRLSVRDNGPGVAPADRARIFERFFRGGEGETSSGHGLGLNISKAIAELHGLDLRLEESGTGALFVMAPVVEKTPFA